MASTGAQDADSANPRIRRDSLAQEAQRSALPRLWLCAADARRSLGARLPSLKRSVPNQLDL